MSDIDKVCCVCLEAPRTLRFAPCSHANSCETCTIKLIQHALHKQLKCPACQTVVEKLESQFVPPATKAMEAKGEAESRPENAAAPLPPIARQDSYLPVPLRKRVAEVRARQLPRRKKQPGRPATVWGSRMAWSAPSAMR